LKFYSNGKLLITSEYLVLDGAKALALPTKYGQDLIINSTLNNKKVLNWNSFDLKGDIWFNCKLELPSLELLNYSNFEIAKTLQKILLESKKLNKYFLQTNDEINIKTNLNFYRNWGLGTSSTLINNIASWANINAFDLQFKIFGGSAYDIACAQNNKPILYKLNEGIPIVKKVEFNPIFKEKLFFIHLNKKQNSRDAIKYYKNKTISNSVISEISNITDSIINCKTLSEFEFLINNHENIISSIINKKTIKNRLFNDYIGQIKSLGAWGGDFILATGNEKTISYFKNKGFQTVISYSDLII